MSKAPPNLAPAAKTPAIPRPRRSRPRSPGSWTPSTCPTKAGEKPRHAVGRPKGSLDRLPRNPGNLPVNARGVPQLPRGTVAGLFRHLAETKPQLYASAIRRGLAAGGARSYPFVALGAAYLDGKPIERLIVQADARMLFVPGQGALAAAVPDLGDDE